MKVILVICLLLAAVSTRDVAAYQKAAKEELANLIGWFKSLVVYDEAEYKWVQDAVKAVQGQDSICGGMEAVYNMGYDYFYKDAEMFEENNYRYFKNKELQAAREKTRRMRRLMRNPRWLEDAAAGEEKSKYSGLTKKQLDGFEKLIAEFDWEGEGIPKFEASDFKTCCNKNTIKSLDDWKLCVRLQAPFDTVFSNKVYQGLPKMCLDLANSAQETCSDIKDEDDIKECDVELAAVHKLVNEREQHEVEGLPSHPQIWHTPIGHGIRAYEKACNIKRREDRVYKLKHADPCTGTPGNPEACAERKAIEAESKRMRDKNASYDAQLKAIKEKGEAERKKIREDYEREKKEDAIALEKEIAASRQAWKDGAAERKRKFEAEKARLHDVFMKKYFPNGRM